MLKTKKLNSKQNLKNLYNLRGKNEKNSFKKINHNQYNYVKTNEILIECVDEILADKNTQNK